MNLTPTPAWDSVVQLETTTPAKGGVNGHMNAQAQSLLNRTELLNANKLNSSGGTLTSVIEQVTVSSTSGIIDCANGLIHQRNLTAPTTISFTGMSSGTSATLHLVTNGNIVTWPVSMKWVGGSAPTLTDHDVIVFWTVESQLYASYVGSIS